MARKLRIHWLAPATMMSAFLVGSTLALGHHLFYASLAGTETPTGVYNIAGKHVSLQQLNTAVGTAFGFLVKSFLTVAISIAFAQAFWTAAKSSNNGTTLATLDSTYSLLSNLLGLCDRHTWRNFPVPLALTLFNLLGTTIESIGCPQIGALTRGGVDLNSHLQSIYPGASKAKSGL